MSDPIRAELAKLRNQMHSLKAENADLLAGVVTAPHDGECNSLIVRANCGWPPGDRCFWIISPCLTHSPEKYGCDCWKAPMLAKYGGAK